MDRAGQTELQYGHVMTGATSSSRLPTIHPLAILRELVIGDATTRFHQVGTCGKEFVGARQALTSQFLLQ